MSFVSPTAWDVRATRKIVHSFVDPDENGFVLALTNPFVFEVAEV